MDKLQLSDPSAPIVPLNNRIEPAIPKNLPHEFNIPGYDFGKVPFKRMLPRRKWKHEHELHPLEKMWMLEKHMETAQMPEPLYNKDGLPILPDGSSRLFTLMELTALLPRNQVNLPKRRKVGPPKRKNPPPKKVNMEAMFQEEAARQKKEEAMK